MSSASSPGSPDRRAFLTGRAVRDGVRDRAAAASEHEIGDFDETPLAAPLLSVGRSAMACEFEALFNAGEHPQAVEAAEEGLNAVDDLEAQLSAFRDSSELSYVNREAALRPVRVEPGLFRLIEYALALSEQTAGAFDLTAAPLWRAWGFHRRQGRLPPTEAIAAAREQVGWRGVILDAAARTISFANSGLELNLGSVGKGYAQDHMANRLLDRGVQDFLLNAGQSSIRAAGSRRRRSNRAAGWTVGVSHPLHPERRIAEFQLHDAALATSGSVRQFFYHQGRRLGHVIDPRSGWPAEGVLSATVVAPTALEADAVSTACFVLGPAETESLCAIRKGVGVLLALPGAAAGAIELASFGMDDVSWRTV